MGILETWSGYRKESQKELQDMFDVLVKYMYEKHTNRGLEKNEDVFDGNIYYPADIRKGKNGIPNNIWISESCSCMENFCHFLR